MTTTNPFGHPPSPEGPMRATMEPAVMLLSFTQSSMVAPAVSAVGDTVCCGLVDVTPVKALARLT